MARTPRKPTPEPRALSYTEVLEAISRVETSAGTAIDDSAQARRDVRIWRCFMLGFGMKSTGRHNTPSRDPSSLASASALLAEGCVRATANPFTFAAQLYLYDWSNRVGRETPRIEQFFAFCIVEHSGASGRAINAYQVAHGHPGGLPRSVTAYSVPAGDFETFCVQIGPMARASWASYFSSLPAPEFKNPKTNLLALAELDGHSEARAEAEELADSLPGTSAAQPKAASARRAARL